MGQAAQGIFPGGRLTLVHRITPMSPTLVTQMTIIYSSNESRG